MIDPEHLNDLKELPVGHAARAAFGHAAEAAGLTSDAFHPLQVEFYSLLVLTVGEDCTAGHVSSALHLAGDQIEGSGDSVMISYADWFLLRQTHEAAGEAEPVPIPVEKFVREAAAALAALHLFEPGERVRLGQNRATAAPGVILRSGDHDRHYWVSTTPDGEPWQEDTGRIWRVPLTKPTPFPARRDDNNHHPGGVA